MKFKKTNSLLSMFFYLVGCTISDTNFIIVDVSIYSNHILLSKPNGQIYTWGRNNEGQLGDGLFVDRLYPAEISFNFGLEEKERIISLQVGYGFSGVLTSHNRLFMWGKNNHGQLGNGTTINQITPIDIAQFISLESDEKIESLTLGYSHSALLTSLGRIFTWGNNESGQLGNGTNISRPFPTQITSQFNLLNNEKIKKLYISEYFSGALSSSGRIFTWGWDLFGRLGNSSNIQDVNSPYEITNLFNLYEGEKITDFQLSSWNASAITSKNRFFKWGYQYPLDIETPIEIENISIFLKTHKVNLYDMGFDHFGLIDDDNQLFVWGKNRNGQLGNGSTVFEEEPINITHLFPLKNNDKIHNLLLGDNYSAAITAKNRVFFWGGNFWGQFGDGTNENSSLPVELVL